MLTVLVLIAGGSLSLQWEDHKAIGVITTQIALTNQIQDEQTKVLDRHEMLFSSLLSDADLPKRISIQRQK